MTEERTVKVNILNSGRIRWLNLYGPLKGVTITSVVLDILTRDPKMKIEVLDEDGNIKKRYGIRENDLKVPSLNKVTEAVNLSDTIVLSQNIEKETPDVTFLSFGELCSSKVDINDFKDDGLVIETVDSSEIDIPAEIAVTEATTDSEIDEAIDNAIENLPDEEEDFVVAFQEEKKENNVKTYSEEELLTMTKNQLKEILKERGYESGEYAPKYHDTLDKLIKKVLQTQTI